MAGTFTKKKKCKRKKLLTLVSNCICDPLHFHLHWWFMSVDVVSGVYCDVPAWPGRDEEHDEQKCYFGIQTADRVIEFECRNKGEKQMWVDGIQQFLSCRMSITWLWMNMSEESQTVVLRATDKAWLPKSKIQKSEKQWIVKL